MSRVADYIVIGAGSAGCIVAAELVAREAGTVLLVEAGPSDRHPLVKTPMGLIALMGGARDWRFESAPQAALNGRQVNIPRGRMVGGSGSINSMVWFRGRRDDFDGWAVPGWAWADVEPSFESVEAKLLPSQLAGAHPLVTQLHRMFKANDGAAPSPERESAGVFCFNLRDGQRWSAADAFLRPARQSAALTLLTGRMIQKITLSQARARSVVFADGSTATARKGIVLTAGSIGSPEILLRSGIGPAADLKAAAIDIVHPSDEIGANLHDHPAVGLHYAGANAGYGLTLAQAPAWALAPLRYLISRTGRLASPTVEGGAFFNAAGDGGAPDVQSHFIPFMLGWKGSRFTYGAGYFADVCVCRPKSRGTLRITPEGLAIDLGLLCDPVDLELLVAGVNRLRALLAETDLGPHQAAEAYPGPGVASDEALRRHIRAHAGTAYHPVGTLRMGADKTAPVTPRLALRGVGNLWVADASVMPAVTSANTNAPSMMIGHKAAQMIAEDPA